VDCPLCHGDEVRVLRTDGDRRRRECARCRHRWTTIEVTEQELEADRRIAKAVRKAVQEAA
jgi:transcriptional regulator NrdR family protein